MLGEELPDVEAEPLDDARGVDLDPVDRIVGASSAPPIARSTVSVKVPDPAPAESVISPSITRVPSPPSMSTGSARIVISMPWTGSSPGSYVQVPSSPSHE